MALYRNVSWDELNSLGAGMPSADQTRLYNALGRSNGSNDDNFFVKRGKSLGNAFGTTGAAIASLGNDLAENARLGQRNASYQQRMDDIVKNAGFNNVDEYQAAKDATEKDILSKYGLNYDDYYNKRSELTLNDPFGESEEVKALDRDFEAAKEATRNRMSAEDASTFDRFNEIENNLKSQSATNANEAQEAAKKYEDYRKNDYISQKINQDRGKFAGSAINTLSTMFDVMAPGAGVLANSVQGGIEGIADELEQNGLENFDWNRAGQNALIGATTGAVTGGINKGISNQLAKNGGNLLKGEKGIGKILNNLGSSTAVGRIGSTLATGAARGAISGAAGGATGAGLSAALNNQDVLGSAIEGAKRGATQGAMAGSVMAGANMAASKTPGIGTAMQKFNEAGEDWNTRKANGESFGERLANTWDESTVKNSKLGQRVGEDWNAVKQGFKNVGEGVSTLAKRGMSAVDDTYTQAVNRNAVERLSNALDEAANGGTKGNTKFVRISNDLLDEFNNIRNANGLEPLSRRQVTAYENAINENLINRVREGMSTNDVAQMAFNALTSDNSKAVPGYYENQVAVSAPGMANDYDGAVIGRASNGDTSLKSIEPRTNSQIAMFEQTGQQKIGPKSQLGSSPVEEQPVNNSIVPQNRQNVNTLPEDIQNMRTNTGVSLTDQAENILGKYNLIDQDIPSQTPEYGNYVSQRSNAIQELRNNFSDNDLAFLFTKTDSPKLRALISDTVESPEIRNRLADYAGETLTQNATPETELYRTLTGDNGGNGENPEQPFMAYGESGLATGKTKKQNLLSKAGRAMQAAQANATRKETRDIGIDNAGDLIDRVRKRSGLTDLEKQAAFGKELTGGEKSLLDEVQRNAIASTEDGSARTVDLSSLEPKINKLIDDMPNTLVSPTKKEEIRSAVFADLRNGGIDTIKKANNFKSAGSQQFLINERTPNDSAKEQGKLYMKIGDLVDEASYAQVPKSQVEAMFNIAENESRARAQVAANEGRKEYETAYSLLADELKSSPRTIEAFRNLKKDYVDISKLNKKTQQGSTTWNNSPLTMGTALTAAMATGNPLLAVPAAWAAKTFAPAVGQAAIDASAKVGGKLADLGDGWTTRKTNTPTTKSTDVIETSYNPSTRVYEAIGRTEGLTNAEQARTANYLTDAVEQAQNTGNQANTLESLINPSASTSTNSVYNSMYGNNGTNNATLAKANTSKSYFPTTGDYWTDILGAAMTSAMDADDVTAFASLYGMYQDALNNLKKSQTSTSNQKLTSTQQRANAAMNSLERLSSMTPDLGYNLSGVPVIGNIATLGGNDYEGEAKSLAQQIGYMVSGANIKEEEAYNIGKAYVPQPFDSEGTRKIKLQRAYDIIRQYQAGTAEEA